MKIYNMVKMDMHGNVLEEDSFEYDGPIAECKGPSGAVSFPGYMEDFHKYLLLDNGTGVSPNLGTSYSEIAAAMLAAASPYNGVNAYDPDAELDNNDARYSSHNALVTALSAQSDWNTQLTNAAAKADDATLFPKVNLIDDDMKVDAVSDAVAAAAAAQSASGVSDQVSQFDTRGKEALSRARNRFLTSAAQNKTLHSATVIGMALLERGHLDTVNEFSANLGKGAFDNALNIILNGQVDAAKRRREFRNQVVAQGSQFVVDTQRRDVGLSAEATRIMMEKSRNRIVAMSDWTDRNLEIDVADAFYDLDVMDRLSNAMTSINGAPSISQTKVSRTQSALGGAAAGASLGSQAGPWGMGAGALIGGLAGYFA